MDRYIHYTSNQHPKTIKLGVIKCLKARAEKMCDHNHMRRVVKHLRNVFIKNGYPMGKIRTALRNKPTKEEERGPDEEERAAGQPRRNTPCFLPYVKGTSKRVGKICQKFGCCILSPLLFNCFMDWILQELITESGGGLKVEYRLSVMEELSCLIETRHTWLWTYITPSMPTT